MKELLPLALSCMIMANAPAIAGETAYGYLFGSKTGENGFVSFDIDNPQKLTVKTVYTVIYTLRQANMSTAGYTHIR